MMTHEMYEQLDKDQLIQLLIRADLNKIELKKIKEDLIRAKIVMCVQAVLLFILGFLIF